MRVDTPAEEHPERKQRRERELPESALMTIKETGEN
jgi:hypothetical protein